MSLFFDETYSRVFKSDHLNRFMRKIMATTLHRLFPFSLCMRTPYCLAKAFSMKAEVWLIISSVIFKC